MRRWLWMFGWWTVAAGVGAADLAPDVSMERRGLLSAGAARGNLIGFADGWKYAAQDYALKDIRFNGRDRVEGRFEVGGRSVRLVQTVRPLEQDGRRGVTATYTVTSEAPVSFDDLYLQFSFPTDALPDRKFTADGRDYPLPDAVDKEYVPFVQRFGRVDASVKGRTFTLLADNRRVSLVDGRFRKADAFQLRLHFDGLKNFTKTELAFKLLFDGATYRVEAGAAWRPLAFPRDVVEGGPLDFSGLIDPAHTGPAGRFGFLVVGRDGHFEFEKRPGVPVRLMGTNLCYTANYLEKADADRLAALFRRMGYNTVRFHHYDVDLLKGGWNAPISHDFAPDQLDRLDYLFAAMKNAGLYVTIDLMSSRKFPKGEIPGWDRDAHWDFKALFPIVPGAFDAFEKFAAKLLNHVNPYTGLAWKDDPALVSICPLNEDSIASVWKTNKPVEEAYRARFNEWIAERGRTPPAADAKLEDSPLFAEFLNDVKIASNRRLAAFLKDLGVRALVTGDNWWDTMIQTQTRADFDFVDNHLYADHPYGWPESRWNQKSALREKNIAYAMPGLKMPTRIFGKPFTVSEFNWCAPNQFRAEGGAMMGAYAALQGWDALYRFAWAHDRKDITALRAMRQFDTAVDPLSMLTEKQIMLLFGRGDVKPAKRAMVYAVTMRDAARRGLGDMWSRGLFPRAFTQQGFNARIGSQWIDDGRALAGAFDMVVAPEPLADSAALGDRPFTLLRDLPDPVRVDGEYVSDTEEIFFNPDRGTLRVVTPRTEALVGPAGVDLAGKALAVSGKDEFASVSASAMDGRALADSGRVIVFHLVNVLGEGMEFENDEMKRVWHWGSPAFLARAATATVTLRNADPTLRVHALDLAGERLRPVDATYRDGAYTFQATTAGDHTPAALVYELAAP